MKLIRKLAWLFALALCLLPLVAVLAQTSTEGDYLPPPTGSSTGDTLVTLALPFVVMGGTWLVTYFFPKLPGWLIPAVIVPVIATLIGVTANYLTGTHQWWVKAMIGLGAVLLHQVKQQVERGDTVSTATKVTH